MCSVGAERNAPHSIVKIILFVSVYGHRQCFLF